MIEPDSAAKYLSDAKTLTERFKEGTKDSARAFGELVQLWLNLTVLKEGQSVRFFSRKDRDRKKAGDVFVVSGHDMEPLRLRDDRYLWLNFELFLEKKPGKGRRLKVANSVAWYSVDRERKRRIFRYEYIREPDHQYAGSHLHIHGTLDERDVLPEDKPLYKVHFPTSRVSLEAVIRLLVEDFGVPTNTDPNVWRPVLAWTEEEFRKIKHEQISGPRR